MKTKLANHHMSKALGLALITLLAWASAGVPPAQAQPFNVNSANREDVRVFFNTVYQASEGVAPGWTGNVAACNPGTVSQAYQDATLLRVNYFRAMAGLPATVTFTAANNASAQAAALIMSANGRLSHEPPATWTCFTQAGLAGARFSNLNMGSSGARSIDSFMQDGGDNNAEVGHRRWILQPEQLTMGSGHIPGATANEWRGVTAALYVFGDKAPQRPPVRDEFVAWPTKGFVPYKVVYPRWSFSLASANFDNATVTMQRNGAEIPVRIEARITRQQAINPESSIIWIPNNLNHSVAWAKPAADEIYTVNVNNVVVDGAPRNFIYTVAIFDPAVPGAGSAPPTITGPEAPPLNQNTTYNFSAVPNATAYQWRSTKLTPFNLTDGAENGLVNFTAAGTAGGTPPLDMTVRANGNASFRFMNAFERQTLTLNRALLAGPNSQVTFKSRFENIQALAARVEVSTDAGATWEPVFNHTGTDAREGAFSDKVVGLGNLAGRQIQVRFSLNYVGGPLFSCCDPIGWYFDDIAFVNLLEVAAPVVNPVTAGTSFAFNPTEASAFALDVRPQYFGQYFGEWGPAKRVSTITTAPAAPPVITAQPQNRIVTVGANVEFTVTATSATPLTYQWKRGGTDLADNPDIQGSRTATLMLRNAQVAQAGNYTVVVSSPSGNTTSNPGQLTVNPPPTLPAVVEVPPATPVMTGGEEGWIPEFAGDGGGNFGEGAGGLRPAAIRAASDSDEHYRDGEDSARSGRIGHSQQTYLEITATGPAVISFWWRVDSEANYDVLELQLDGSPLFKVSGLVDWEQRFVDLPSGEHELRWVYRKDESVSSGADSGWVDLIEIFDDEPPATLAEGLDANNIVWASTGDYPWFTQTDVTHDGDVAAQSGPVDEDQESRLEAIVTGPAELSFWWLLDSEVSDTVSFELDGRSLFVESTGSLDAEDDTLDGLIDWEQRTFTIPDGKHRVSWVYRGGYAFSEYYGAAYLDEVCLTKLTPGQGGVPGPKIEYTASGQKLQLSWTDAATTYRLQSSPSLTAPNWQDVPPNQIQQGDGEFAVTVNTASGIRFYRLAP